MNRFFRQTSRKIPVSVCIMSLVLFNGCAMQGPGSLSAGAGCGYGAAGGAVLGGAAGALLGGKRDRLKNVLIGATAGAALGCVAGFAFAKYLTPQESQQYNAALNQQMKNASLKKGGSYTWYSPDGTKRIDSRYGQPMQIQAALSQIGPNARINQEVYSRLPQPPEFCRIVPSRISIKGGPSVAQTQLRCVDANGDMVDVLDHTTA
jgi:hypothetical protein